LADIAQHKWQFWIDRGGTFTDVIGYRSDGVAVVHKLLSEDRERYDDAAIQGIRDVLMLHDQDPLPHDVISCIKMGTTVATNALLERNGERTLLIVNDGFADALRIAYQNRPDIFARHIILPQLLYEKVLELPCRVCANGEVLKQFDQVASQATLQSAYDEGYRSCAIVFMHGYAYPQHELECAAIAKSIGFTQISVSHQVSPLIKFVSRGDTTVADAYLSPILNRYLEGLKADLGDTQLLFMQSNGGLVDKSLFRGKDSLLSGPAGGVVGAVKIAEAVGINKIIGFDMGGTSTDVFHFDGEFERQMESQISGITIRVPMMSITTIAAGGGSIVGFDNGRFKVGPESARAMPGPACYRNGGPLTITDCNVLLGRIQKNYFPAVFGPTHDQPLDVDALGEKFEELRRQLQAPEYQTYHRLEEVAEGFLSVAVQKMAQAIKKVSIEKGHDVSGYALVSFGGAGGQHACLVAECLGIQTVLIHPLAGVLSAVGIGLADISTINQHAVQEKLDDSTEPLIQSYFKNLTKQCTDTLCAQGVDCNRIQIVRRLLVHYDGSDSSLIIDCDDFDRVRESFEATHKKRYGFYIADKDLIVEAALVEARGKSLDSDVVDSLRNSRPRGVARVVQSPSRSVRLFSKGSWHDVSIYSRENLADGALITGPAIISEDTSTTIVEVGWSARQMSGGHLMLHCDDSGSLPRSSIPSQKSEAHEKADPVLLELFNNMFMSVAEEMGTTLQQTSHSVNIKERLDFSCAIFDASGELIANAPHIPVHLGSMGESVRIIIKNRSQSMRPGDVFVLNDPYNGGTHLPDITVVTPIFGDDRSTDNQTVIFFTASRGHHSDIGGITPGSMPPASSLIEQEGILINDFQIVENGEFLENEIKVLLSSGPFPARNVARNISDLKAQIAANNRGASGLHTMVAKYGIESVQAYMQFIRDNAEASVRRAIGKLKDGHFAYAMDDGSRISVSIKVNKEDNSAIIDFAGTSAQLSNNFNAPVSVCKAAVLYVFRTIIDDNIPLNGGCFKPLTIKIPEGSMLSPHYPAAVVAGNVETSQCIVDALYGALGTMSASQGTMNNFTFGNDHYQYYETIAGGSGAGPSFPGTDAVQTHMTNSRLTDPEILEWRFPVLVESFAIRKGSGGGGKFPGGNGVIRRIKFNEKMTASILSGRRIVPPFGSQGGEPGQTGFNSLERENGAIEVVRGTQSVEVEPGDTFVIATPGGGGWGAS
jgi:5-oxoprolinase (ATP-hydrolysing)